MSHQAHPIYCHSNMALYVLTIKQLSQILHSMILKKNSVFSDIICKIKVTRTTDRSHRDLSYPAAQERRTILAWSLSPAAAPAQACPTPGPVPAQACPPPGPTTPGLHQLNTCGWIRRDLNGFCINKKNELNSFLITEISNKIPKYIVVICINILHSRRSKAQHHAFN